MKKRILSFLLVLVMLMSTLIGCTQSSGNLEGSKSPQGSQDPAPVTVNKDKLTLFINADVSSFDPTLSSSSASQIVTSQIYDPLVFVNGKHEVENRLAEKYSVSEDNLVYTFEIKKGVKFHNGEELKADDVVFSIERVMESPFFFSMVESVDRAEAVDDYTVKIYMKDVNAPFIDSLSYIMIFNRKAVEEAGDSYSDNPVGTGPYKYVSYEAGVDVKLTRFEDYYRGPARVKDVTYRIIPDRNTATISLRTGEIDAGPFALSAYDSVVNEANLVTQEWSSNVVNYLAVNHEVAPFDNKLVRQALNYAIDREYIVDVATEGHATLSTIMLPEVVFGFSDQINQTYTYDPEKAKELLKEAGITTPMNVGTITMADDVNKGIAEALQQCLADVGLTADIEVLEMNKYFDETDSGNYEICLNAIALTMDADSYAPLYAADQINGLNTARYNNPQVEELFAQARSTLNTEERLKKYAEAYNKINDDAVYVPIYMTKSVFAYNKNLKIDNIYPSIQFAYEMHWD